MQTRGSEQSGVREAVVWGVLGVFVVSVAVGLVGRYRRAERLRTAITQERASIERGAEGVRRTDDDEKAVVDAAELARLRGDREALERLRGEVAALKKSVSETRPLPARKAKEGEGVAPDIAKEIVPAEAWRNAGYATPATAIETALWAAAGGDTDVLMKSLVLSEGARRKTEALLADLPKEMRQRYAGPEEWVAFMTAKDVPLEGARIMVSDDQSGETRKAVVQLRNAAGSVRQVQIELGSATDGWRLVVPEAAVERYAEQLKGKAR